MIGFDYGNNSVGMNLITIVFATKATISASYLI
jgi:hypothetical protein